MLTYEDFMSRLQSVINGELSEDEIVAVLGELEQDKLKSIALKSKKISDFFNRTDSDTATEDEKEDTETTTEEQEEDPETVDDIVKDLSTDEEEEDK